MFGIEGHSIETMVEMLAGVTLLIAWVFVQVAFARYYAHEFYRRKAGSDNSGFEFPVILIQIIVISSDSRSL
jgi:uncharacterized membrane protein